MTRPPELNLSNWRQPAVNRWAFHHVREIIPCESIACADDASDLPRDIDSRLASLSLGQWLEASSSDALLVARRGELVHEWYAQEALETSPHIVFSVSKSITATLAGVLVGQGLIDPASLVTDIIPELAGSGFDGASLQQVLDMQVSLDFEENYEASEGKFIEYRAATGWHPCEIDQFDVGLHEFLCSLKSGGRKHGKRFVYRSPNSDLLGWILERASGQRLASLLSECLWQPLGAEAEAYVTLDRKGSARSAGGICVRPRDLLRFGEMIRNQGFANGRQIVPRTWIEDCSQGGDREAWLRSESRARFPEGKYRNQWYQSGNDHQALVAIGIHSQWIYIDPVTETTVVKLSSQDTPLNFDLGMLNLRVFEVICNTG